jgi:hypothetical protein
MKTAHPRPSRATALREAVAWVEETGRLPEGRLAEQIRRAYARGTLGQTTLALLRAHGADVSWFAPRKVAFARNLAAIVFFFVVTGRLPREGETIRLAPGSDGIVGSTAGRWLCELRAAAARLGPDSADQQLLDAIETLAAAVTAGARR